MISTLKTEYFTMRDLHTAHPSVFEPLWGNQKTGRLVIICEFQSNYWYLFFLSILQSGSNFANLVIGRVKFVQLFLKRKSGATGDKIRDVTENIFRALCTFCKESQERLMRKMLANFSGRGWSTKSVDYFGTSEYFSGRKKDDL